MNKRVDEILDVVALEVSEAMKRYPKFASYHEGWAVMYEEVCELFEEIRKKQLPPKGSVGALIAEPSKYQNAEKIKAEAVQVCAMAVRLILDCCEVGQNGKTVKLEER